MSDRVVEDFIPKQISASVNINAGATPGRFYLGGVFVSAASNTPTITIYDDQGTGTTSKVIDTFTPVAGTFYPMPFLFTQGINIVIGGTVSLTAGYLPA